MIQARSRWCFSAHAFNRDRVEKSGTAQEIYTLPSPIASKLGIAYIVTIGVNASESSAYDLRFAANDARRLREELSRRISADRFRKTVQVELISDYGDRGELAVNNATKAKLKAVFDKLAGKPVSPSLS